jgi:tellurite resistance protein
MQIDAAQFTKIMYAVYERFEPKSSEVGYRETGAPASKLTAPEAELVVAIAQLAVAADRVEDPDESALFNQLAGHIYQHANVKTTPPTLGPVEDADQRLDHLRSHAAQLQGKASAALAYAVAYILAISDMDLDPDEGEMLDVLCEALGLDEEKADDLLPVVSELLTPVE